MVTSRFPHNSIDGLVKGNAERQAEPDDIDYQMQKVVHQLKGMLEPSAVDFTNSTSEMIQLSLAVSAKRIADTLPIILAQAHNIHAVLGQINASQGTTTSAIYSIEHALQSNNSTLRIKLDK